ncbi:MAG: TIGR02186 family protein [Rhodospirillales bacterium]|nr:TIGR02186 family protein [Rhodospirillales bacterium]
MRALCLTIWLCLSLVPLATAQAQKKGLVTIDLADDHVDITTGFTGARLTLFGVKEHAGDIAIVVRGPEKDMVVRKKSQIFGVWMNTESVLFRDVPAYYDFASSVQERDIASPDVRQRQGIGLDSLTIRHSGREEPETVRQFREALVRNKQVQGLFSLEPENIYFLNDNFFRANFYLPADVPTGDYTIETFLFDKGALLDRYETRLRVAQVGFSARLRRFAMVQGIMYGLVAVVLAVLAGWAAYMLWRKD